MAGVSAAFAQNKYEEVIRYTEADGCILIPVSVKGKSYRFLLDPGDAASTAVLAEYADELGVETNGQTPEYPKPMLKTVDAGSLEKVGVGENIFRQKAGVYVINDGGWLKSLGVVGCIGAEFFAGNVLTINSQNKTITVSSPYKPSYVQLRNRTDMNPVNTVKMMVAGEIVSVQFDLTNPDLLTLSASDFDRLKGRLGQPREAANLPSPKRTYSADVKFVNKDISGADVVYDDVAELKTSVLGGAVLNYGVLTIDYTKAKVYFEPFETLDASKLVPAEVAPAVVEEGNIVHLDRAAFLELVFNFRESDTWKFKGDKPAVIDFWATWCGPCKKLAPAFERVATEYAGKVDFYKVDIDREPEIAKYFNITSIPVLLYIPVEGDPFLELGIRPDEAIKSNVEKILK